MDYILFHSQYSTSSQKLIEQFPSILEKAVLVDSMAMRAYAKRLHIICVPTLIIIMDNKIVERIVGYENIHNWLVVTIYRVNKLQPIEESQPPPEIEYEESQQPMVQKSNLHSPPESTSLEDLILEDIKEEQPPMMERPHVQMGMGTNTLQLAEAMKKERDNIDPVNKKKFSA